MHTPGPRSAEGFYLLAATLADPAECDAIRDALRELLIGRNSRLHWRYELPAHRRRVIDAVSRLRVNHVVVVGVPFNPRKQERARRLCMEVLAAELVARGATRVWIESRKQVQDQRDARMFDALRDKKVIGPGLRLGFAKPSGEPMLWLPDAIAGVVGSSQRGESPELRSLLSGTVVEVPRRLS